MNDRSAETVAVRVRVRGRVQGVWYRAWTVKCARRLGLTGWVRNCDDGSVEAQFVGRSDAVEAMVARCRDGPPLAQVTEVERRPGADDGNVDFRELSDG